jgi:hypothetical protein
MLNSLNQFPSAFVQLRRYVCTACFEANATVPHFHELLTVKVNGSPLTLQHPARLNVYLTDTHPASDTLSLTSLTNLSVLFMSQFIQRYFFKCIWYEWWGPQSSVRILFMPWSKWPGFESRQVKVFLFSPPRLHRLWDQPDPYAKVPGAVHLPAQPPRPEGNQSLTFSSDVKNVWSFTPTSLYIFVAWFWIHHRD